MCLHAGGPGGALQETSTVGFETRVMGLDLISGGMTEELLISCY